MRAFTLIEMMVSISLLMLLMLVTLSILNAVTAIDTRTRAKVDTFREARAGFEVMTRRVSQAMLNTYWDYEFPNNDRSKAPTKYVRQSELHFISGPTKLGGATALLPDAGMLSVTHGIFFQTPQGLTTGTATNISANLPNLLNSSGYFIEYATDLAAKTVRGYTERPAFLLSGTPLPAERWRFRLTEFNQGSEYLQVYRATSPTPSIAALDWFRTALKRPTPTSEPANTRVLAENVVALVILPHRSKNDIVPSGALTQLAPSYLYNSRGYVTAPSDQYALLSRNQLPPMVQVTMVVMDERSAERFQTSLGASPQTIATATTKLGLTSGTTGLFVKPSTTANPVLGSDQEKNQYLLDLKTLEQTLVNLNITYRVFSTDVSILQAKWSE
ncbi:MAG: Verru_Chthon cassette protein C [Chthoniobacter sp.]|nr:Verru_Chthon cassette protein C [Chthoniobacter sp.]